jgi:hypothetical protein
VGGNTLTTQITKQAVPSQAASVESVAKSNVTTAKTEQITPSNDLLTTAQHSLGDKKQGILLLPTDGSTSDVPALFSDVVAVRENADGSRTVVPIDSAGNQIGNAVPFVVVPVTER